MKFAKYWQKIDLTVNKELFGRSDISVWGASNDSLELAKVAAENRVTRLKEFVANGFDKRHGYEYWTGFIKEEVVEEISSDNGNVLAVLTRNSYGATVLNTESVLFGDIDISAPGLMGRILEKFGKKQKNKQYYLEQIETYQKSATDLSFKVYETYAGLRFVVTNRVFSPEDSVVKKIFSQLNVDPLYVRLCKQQSCFRARLTPKPWRIGMERPASRFPRASDREQREFELWLKKYRLASTHKTATKLLASFGSKQIHPDVAKVLDIHDDYAGKHVAELA